MSILFGHPTGNPNSHHAALAHLEAGRLEAFFVPWMPTDGQLKLLRRIPGIRSEVARLERRSFKPLLAAPRVEGHFGEWCRMAQRVLFNGRFAGQRLSYEANDWLMRTMQQQCLRPMVTAVHAYEDCSLWQFQEAKRLGKACIYDMPIGYYGWWERKQAELAQRYADWMPADESSAKIQVRPEQKQREMELADAVLAPSSFVRSTILESFDDKMVILAPYGVDGEFWTPAEEANTEERMRFVFAGQISVRKGVPMLLEAWRRAELKNAELRLVGSWKLAYSKRFGLPLGAKWIGPVSRDRLRTELQAADVFVFPTFFEGRALVVGEAMACGLPVLTTEASGMTDLVDETNGSIIPSGDEEALVEALRWFSGNRERLQEMKQGARAKAMSCTWQDYRRYVREAVGPFV